MTDGEGSAAVTDESSEPDDRPWERFGALRRDCEPHRALLLLGLGGMSFAFGLLAWLCGVPALAGLPLGIAAWKLAAADRQKMNAGAMDWSGLPSAEIGQALGICGVILSVIGAPFGTFFVLSEMGVI
jgi:hypothetical protein